MRQFKGWIVLFVVLIGILAATLSSGTAEELEKETIIISGMTAHSVEPIPEGKLLIAGFVGEPMDSVAALRIYDLRGNILWEMQREPMKDSNEMFHAASYVDEQTLLAIRSRRIQQSGEYCWTLDRLIDGQVVESTDNIENAFKLYESENGFYVTSSGISAGKQVEIRKFNPELQQEWALEIQEPLIIEGILVGKDYSVAYGISQDQDADMSTPWYSFLFAFDDDGTILWRAEPSLHTVFRDAAWDGEGNVAVIGSQDMEPDMFKEKIVPFFAKYGVQGRVSRVDYDGYTIEVNGEIRETYGAMVAMLPVDDGYLVAESIFGMDKLQMKLISKEGASVKLWTEDVEVKNGFDVSNLFCIDGKYYFIGKQRKDLIVREITFPC